MSFAIVVACLVAFLGLLGGVGWLVYQGLRFVQELKQVLEFEALGRKQAAELHASLVQSIVLSGYEHLSARSAGEAADAASTRARTQADIQMLQDELKRASGVASPELFSDNASKTLRTPDGRELEPLFP